MTPWHAALAKVQKLKDQVDALPSIREATVAGTAPLSVQFDTDTTSVEAYASLVGSLAEGERVLTIRLARYIWILGRRGGSSGTFRAAAGAYTFSGMTAGARKSVTVTFPAGRFNVTPNIQVTCNTAVPEATNASFGSPSTSGFTLYGIRTDDVETLGVTWTATQMTPSSASG